MLPWSVIAHAGMPSSAIFFARSDGRYVNASRALAHRHLHHHHFVI
jgi:hypothetical protein